MVMLYHLFSDDEHRDDFHEYDDDDNDHVFDSGIPVSEVFIFFPAMC